VLTFLDSQAAIQLFSQTGEITHSHQAEVITFRKLCARDWMVILRHTYREANQTADHLASRGSSLPFGFHSVSPSDPLLSHFLLFNSLDLSEPRLIMNKP
ncbi:Putative ribonuclease H protein At1g65750, partial [Linum grandiflorum]